MTVNPDGQRHSQALPRDPSPCGSIPSPSTRQASHMYMLLALGSALLFPCLLVLHPTFLYLENALLLLAIKFPPILQNANQALMSLSKPASFHGAARFSGCSEPHIACFVLYCGLLLLLLLCLFDFVVCSSHLQYIISRQVYILSFLYVLTSTKQLTKIT